MNSENAALAKKYAIAVLDIAGEQFDQQEFGRLQEVTAFLEKHKEILLFLNMPLIQLEVLNQGLSLLFDRFKTAALMKKLVHLLAYKKRSLLLPDVLASILERYRSIHQQAQIAITSFPVLDSASLEQVAAFAQRHLKKTISYEYHVEPSLIAGIRIQSNTHAWEYSVKKQLEAIPEELVWWN